AGVMELPDIVAVTKADLGDAARRARGDAQSALALAHPPAGAWQVPVVLVASATGEGLDDLLGEIARHRDWADDNGAGARRRLVQARAWIEEGIRAAFGRHGLAAVDIDSALATDGPFTAERKLLDELKARCR
ncbi:MAG: methylmalonyl Co-A mutase-associated GTPase MeaB, partial [Hyphomicrobiales bacterium]|nr:methylmalonyl Co-A mutase-associated GTPase MeaB [Hyphomicrobiales bacterium]